MHCIAQHYVNQSTKDPVMQMLIADHKQVANTKQRRKFSAFDVAVFLNQLVMSLIQSQRKHKLDAFTNLSK